VHDQERIFDIRALRVRIDFTRNTMCGPTSMCNANMTISGAIKIKLFIFCK